MKNGGRRDFLRDVLQGSLFFLAAKGGKTMTKDKSASSGTEEEYPSFIKLHRTGVLKRRAEELLEVYKNCTLCPRDCRVDRTKGELGKCQASHKVKVSSAFPHFGEEAPLVGTKGSGTIFLSHCGLRCLYCQNYNISIEGYGEEISDGQLAGLMLGVQKLGCHNVNLVTPTHFVPSIVNAVAAAVPAGLEIPLVYNTSGYEKPEILRLLDGIVDIYMPDFKYWNPAHAARYSSEAYSYPHYAREALREMQRQVGVLRDDARRVATRGLVIRHLVLPNRISGSREVLQFIAREVSKDSYVNIMRQYRPEHEAPKHEEINRRITNKEYGEALGWAREFGLHRLDR